MKFIASTTAIFLAFSCLFSQTTFPWSGTYGGAGTNRTYTTTVSGITMSATIVNSENVWQDASPVWFPTGSTVNGGGCSGISAANQGMLLSTDWTTNTTKTITTTITFSSPVQGPVNFKLYDVNDDGFGSWTDKITISGTNSAAAAVNVFNVGTACVSTGGTVTGSGSTALTYNAGMSTACTCWGNNEINVGSASDCISTVTILYRSAATPTNYNNPKQYVVVSNLTATIPTPLVAPTNITGNTTICQNQSTTLTAVGGTATSQWYTGSCGGTLVGMGTSITVSPTTTTTYFVRNAGTSCTPASSCISAIVTVNPSPTMTSANTATICSGSTLNIPLSSDFGTTYSWIATDNTSVLGESLSAQNATLINNSLTNNSANVQVVNYSVTPSANGCTGTPQTIAVTVNPVPTMTNANTATICTGNALNLALTSNVSATYSWIATDNPNVTGESLTAQNSATISNTLTNSSGISQVVNYTVTPTAGTCIGTAQNIAVTVNTNLPAPTITPNGPTTFCPGGNVQLTSSSTVGNLWSTNETTQTITVNSSGTYTLSYTDANGCSSAQASITITQTAGALPTASISGGAVYCGSDPIAPIQVAVTGIGPWSIDYQIDGVAQAAIVGASSPINLGNAVGVYTLTGISDANCSNTATGSTTISLGNTPILTNATTANLCTGYTFNLPLTTDIPATFTWVAIDNPNITGEILTNQTNSTITNTLINSTSNPEIVVYQVTPVSTVGACSGLMQTVSVTVNPTPAAPTITANGPTTFCPGGSVQLTSNYATGNLWSTNETTQSITVSNSGTITLSTTINGCVSPNSNIVISQGQGTLPTAIISGGGSFCAGNTVSPIDVNVTGIGPWTIDFTIDGVAQTAATGSTSPITLGNSQGVYALTFVSDLNCSNSANGTTSIEVIPIPALSVNSVSICAGNSGTITATSDIAGGTFLWSPGGETTASITVNPNLTSNYSVVYTLNSCSSVSTSTTVTVNPTPTIAVNNASICQNQTATLTAIPSVSGGTFLWNPNGETTNAISVSPMVSTNYTVVYTLNGCSSSAAQGTVTVNLSPVVSFIADTLSGCVPLTVQFSSTSTSDPNACIWTLSNGSTLTGCNPTFTFDQAGCYDVTLATTLNGCSGSSSAANYICVESNPVAFFTGNPLQLTDENPTIDLENLSTGASTYSWNFGDGGTDSAVNPSHTYAQNDLGYTIELTATSALGCQSTYSINITYDQQLIFYVPNAFTPDDDEHNPVFKPIFTSGYDPYSYNLSIYDRWGEIIFESNDVNEGWDGTYIQTTGLVQDGIYVWRISFKVNNNDERKVYTGHVNLLK